jgi:hypothetical protein
MWGWMRSWTTNVVDVAAMNFAELSLAAFFAINNIRA